MCIELFHSGACSGAFIQPIVGFKTSDSRNVGTRETGIQDRLDRDSRRVPTLETPSDPRATRLFFACRCQV